MKCRNCGAIYSDIQCRLCSEFFCVNCAKSLSIFRDHKIGFECPKCLQSTYVSVDFLEKDFIESQEKFYKEFQKNYAGKSAII